MTHYKGKKIYRKINGNHVKVGIKTYGGNFVMEKDARKGHRKYKEDAFGFNHDVFQRLDDQDIDKIMVDYTDEFGQDHLYVSFPSTWKEKGTVKEAGAEEQIFLSKTDFDKHHRKDQPDKVPA